MEKENNIHCGSDLYEKIIDAACKAEQIGDMVECVTWLIEMQRKLDLYIPGSLHGAVRLCRTLQHDLNDIAENNA